MKEGLLQRIQELAYWRVLIRPLTPLKEELTFARCLELVSSSKVSLRGWDFPHVEHRREDNEGGHGRGADFYESWTEWQGFREFWRMYKSGQFLSYSLLHGEIGMFGDDGGRQVVNTVDATYSVTEFVEFAQRLSRNLPLEGGYELSVSLKNAVGYRLEAGAGRVPFFDRQSNAAADITVAIRVNSADIAKGSVELANSLALKIFDYFGWNPDPAQIRHDQEAFFRREFR